MGGSDDIRRPVWPENPEADAILVGTQEMLLSRALMRGYGMSRFQWPVHFAFLHNDALWVFDEVQVMGAGLCTSAQLEGLRRKLGTARRCRSLWMSATLNLDWLGTVDFREFLQEIRVLRLAEADLLDEVVLSRLRAAKRLHRAAVQFQDGNADQRAQYLEALAQEVARVHQPGQQTLVILNRVERAQELYRRLQPYLPDVGRLVLHARFRPPERRRVEETLGRRPGGSGRVIVSTQAVEAGVDISSRTLLTELAPWPSLVQRFGRCNRFGEYEFADIYWIDIPEGAGQERPYEAADLVEARERMGQLVDAGPASLPRVTEQPRVHHVLRRRDLVDLFNTDPDLSGFDVDISPYVRDLDQAQLQVYWRDFEERPGEGQEPARDELCPVSIGQCRDYLGVKGRTAWRWDPLSGDWRRLDKEQIRPGLVLLLPARDGGYTPDEGFVPKARSRVELVLGEGSRAGEIYGEDPWSSVGGYVRLEVHLKDVAAEVERLSAALDLDSATRAVLWEAALWHDVGKAHEAFQRGIRGAASPDDGILWAKAPIQGPPDYHVIDAEGRRVSRRGFRHELASALAWLQHRSSSSTGDLAAFLIASHHGKVRMGLRALPIESQPSEEDTLFARGVWQGDRLPPVRVGDLEIPETVLRLDLMRLGASLQGPSWMDRTRSLLDQFGPFTLAWLEALLRVSDWRASRNKNEARA